MPERAVLQGYLVQEACESMLLLLSPADKPLVRPKCFCIQQSIEELHSKVLYVLLIVHADNPTTVTALNGCIQHVTHLRTSACFHKPLVLSSHVPLARAFCTI